MHYFYNNCEKQHLGKYLSLTLLNYLKDHIYVFDKNSIHIGYVVVTPVVTLFKNYKMNTTICQKIKLNFLIYLVFTFILCFISGNH